MSQSAPRHEEITAFNIALFPASNELISDCIKFAQDNFALEANGYLLGEEAWPHITLCHFESRFSKIENIWQSLIQIEPHYLSISFDHFYIRPDRDKHKLWLGIAVKPEKNLILLQETIFNKLADFGIESENSPNNYFPHLTCSLCDDNKIPKISSLPSENFWSNAHTFKLSLGQSNPNGVYAKQIFCK